MKPALPAAPGARTREGALVIMLVVSAVVAAVFFDAAVHPERVHDPRHYRLFVGDCEALPSLGAVRVRAEGPLPELGTLGRVTGLTPSATGLFRTGRYLYASPAEIEDAVARLKRGEPPAPPPAAPDLSRYYRDALGPYARDVVLAPGKVPDDIRARLPGVRLSGEPIAREAEGREAASIARALVLGLVAVAGWLAWRRGLREAEGRLLAALGALSALGLVGLGVDRWSLVALLLVAGAPSGAPLLAAAPCLLFPEPALERLGLALSIGGALRLLSQPGQLQWPAVRTGALRAVALALGLGLAGFLLLRAAPVRTVPRPEVAAEPAALLVKPDDVPEAAKRLRAEGFDVTGDETLVPPPADLVARRNVGRIYLLAESLAARSDGEARARFEDVKDAASRTSLYLPRAIRARLRTNDGRAVLWLPAGAERDDLMSARLYRDRGAKGLARSAGLAGVLVITAGSLALALSEGAARRIALRFLSAAAGVALLFVADPAEAPTYVPLVVLAAAAPALGPALALGAAAVLLPALSWPAVALLVAAVVAGYGSIRKPPSPA